MSEKITLDMIRAQQQRVAELGYKKKLADDEYWRAATAKNEASVAQDKAATDYEKGQEKLQKMGKIFALDLSETSYTPQLGEKK